MELNDFTLCVDCVGLRCEKECNLSQKEKEKKRVVILKIDNSFELNRKRINYLLGFHLGFNQVSCRDHHRTTRVLILDRKFFLAYSMWAGLGVGLRAEMNKIPRPA